MNGCRVRGALWLGPRGRCVCVVRADDVPGQLYGGDGAELEVYEGVVGPPLSFGHLPQMPKCTEFGGEECSVDMNSVIYSQIEIDSPPFSVRSFADCKWGR